MEETTESQVAPDAMPVPKLGVVLREKRIAMSLSVADVSAQIRLSPKQIEALEADDWSHLPELAFVRGFIRSYAKLLQLDAAMLLATLPDLHPVHERIEPVSVGEPFQIKQFSKSQNQVWLLASGIVAVIALVFAWWHFSTPVEVKAASAELVVVQQSDVALPDPIAAMSGVNPISGEIESAVPVMAVVSDAVAAKADPVAVPRAEKEAEGAAVAKLHLVFEGDSWSQIKDANGKMLSSQLNTTGSELNLKGKAPYELVIGNAHKVQLYRRGKAVDLSPYINAKSEVARLTLE